VPNGYARPPVDPDRDTMGDGDLEARPDREQTARPRRRRERPTTTTDWQPSYLGNESCGSGSPEPDGPRFDEQPKGSPPLTIPNATLLTRIKPLKQLDTFGQDPARRKGEDVWVGTKN